MIPSPTCSNDRTVDPSTRFRCGTLVYTKAGLFTLFAWLLWGDFCFSLMESIWPNILPLVLKAEGTPNTLIAIVLTTIPSTMNFVLNPIISTASDRYRGKRGRRIPFLLFATPFVAAFLVLLGFSRDLGRGLHGILAGTFPQFTATGVTIGLICVLIICFRFFELFVNTVFWYLFNDVVPTAFMGRFLGFFRVVGSLAGVLFNFFLFQYAESHTSILFFGVALLYGTVFMLMALNVKEGKYPPPEPIERKSPWNWIKVFVSECLSHRLFRKIFAYSALLGMCNSVNTFGVFLALSIGLTLNEIGKIAGAAAFVGMLLMYPMGALVDRFHPLRVMLAATLCYCLVIPANFIFLFYDPSKPMAFWIYATVAAITIPVSVANMAASLPMLMRLFPLEKYGQFSSANAMCMAMGTILGSVFAGLFLDGLKSLFPEGDYLYRFVPVWQFFFMLMAFGMMVLLFREWKKLGGDQSFRPPVTDNFASSFRT